MRRWLISPKYFAIILLLIAVVFAVLRCPDTYASRQVWSPPPSSLSLTASDIGANVSVPSTRREITIEWVNNENSGQDRFYPDLIIVNQGDTVDLTFINNDTVAHNFVIGYPYNIHVNASVPGLTNDLTGQKFTTPATNNSPGVVVHGLPGSVVATYSFVAKYSGIFEFVCTYHISKGMIGYFLVFANSAFNPTVGANVTVPQSPSIAQISIDKDSGVNVNLSGYTATNTMVVIGVNNTVRWINNDNFPHTVTAVDGSFDSGNMNAGQSFVHTFTKAGKYAYFCTYHPWMSGTVTVLNAVNNQQTTTVSSQQTTSVSSLQSSTAKSLQSTTVSSLQSQGYGNFTVTLTGYQIYGMLAFGIVILVMLMIVLARTGRRNQ